MIFFMLLRFTCVYTILLEFNVCVSFRFVFCLILCLKCRFLIIYAVSNKMSCSAS